jgi:DNA invertase Pin-like site-specific DNA recombinase
VKVAIYARVSESIEKCGAVRLSILNRCSTGSGQELGDLYCLTLFGALQESGGTANRMQLLQLFADAHQRRFDLVLF